MKSSPPMALCNRNRRNIHQFRLIKMNTRSILAVTSLLKWLPWRIFLSGTQFYHEQGGFST